MSRKGCPNKVQSGITYPRKCESCDYVSNNPAMYHYHKKTHNLIPEGKLCDGGCGQLAIIINTHGKYTCLPNAHKCPEYLKRHSELVKSQWDKPESNERRIKTRETFDKHCSNNIEVRNKTTSAIRKKYGNLTPEQLKNYRSYARRIRRRSQSWAKQNDYVIGKYTFHVDHKLSIFDAWNANLSIDIVSHPANLQILEAKQNCSKGPKSILTVEELMRLINES